MEPEDFIQLSKIEQALYIENNYVWKGDTGKTKKILYGCCYNNVDFNIMVRLGKKEVLYQHPAYSSWKGILRRCYDDKEHIKNPSYIGCYICEAWKYFKNYLVWWKNNYIEGFQLDKDILYPNNKLYSPETCIYIPQWLNKFVVASNRNRGDNKVGVSWDKQCEKYKARCKMGSGKKVKTLGLFDNDTDAYNAWLSYKLEMLEGMKEDLDSIDKRLYNAVELKIRSIK